MSFCNCCYWPVKAGFIARDKFSNFPKRKIVFCWRSDINIMTRAFLRKVTASREKNEILKRITLELFYSTQGQHCKTTNDYN